MNDIVRVDHVFDYNDSLGCETLHPLVSVIDFSEVRPIRSSLRSFGVYAIFLKDVKCGDMIYGRQTYDYQEGTLVCLAPGQVFGAKDDGQLRQPKGWALLFHPDLLRGTQLGRNIRNYTFFSYEVREALHLSEQERRTILDCLHNIRHELQHAIDRHSRTLVVNNIEMFLNYCVRFYDRQFITRSDVAGKDILALRTHARRLFPLRQTPDRRAAHRAVLRAGAPPVGQLLRRPGQTPDGKDGAGAHPPAAHRRGQGAHRRPRALDRRGGLRTGIQIPRALYQTLQERGRLHSQQVQKHQLTHCATGCPADCSER